MAMERSIAEAQDALRTMGGVEGMQEKMQEVMGQLGKGGGLEEMLRAQLGGESNDPLSSLKDSGGDDELQDRVREQLARMLKDRDAESEDDAVHIDEF